MRAETVALLGRERPHDNWVGVYRLEGDELALGRIVGKPPPHTRIRLDQGIGGAAATTRKTLILDDGNSDPRSLACRPETRSEIVVPILREGRVLGEIDIDSDTTGAFTEDDRKLLESVAEILATRLEGQ